MKEYRYRIEYYVDNKNQCEVFLTSDRFDLIDILDREDINLNKNIQVFEKSKNSDWKLVQILENGKTVFKDYGVLKDLEEKRLNHEQNRMESLSMLPDLFSGNISPSRLENQNFMEITFDHIIGKEDITKPKLTVIR